LNFREEDLGDNRSCLFLQFNVSKFACQVSKSAQTDIDIEPVNQMDSEDFEQFYQSCETLELVDKQMFQFIKNLGKLVDARLYSYAQK
jgi:hypothetical protein